MTSPVLIVGVTVTVTVAGVGQALTTHESPGHDRSAQLYSDQLATSPRPPTPTPNHVNDQPTTTINHLHHELTTTDNTTTNHNQNRSKPIQTLAPCGAVPGSGRHRGR
ncbi:MAG: hypothetical protein M3N25_07030 [Actinomycetota bacterium]|nr:hypothetical protein [Actinomycetota bacterium]